MKINKSILSAIVLGISLGTTASACEKLDLKKEKEELACSDECTDDCPEGENNDPEDCPTCGLG